MTDSLELLVRGTVIMSLLCPRGMEAIMYNGFRVLELISITSYASLQDLQDLGDIIIYDFSPKGWVSDL